MPLHGARCLPARTGSISKKPLRGCPGPAPSPQSRTAAPGHEAFPRGRCCLPTKPHCCFCAKKGEVFGRAGFASARCLLQRPMVGLCLGCAASQLSGQVQGMGAHQPVPWINYVGATRRRLLCLTLVTQKRLLNFLFLRICCYFYIQNASWLFGFRLSATVTSGLLLKSQRQSHEWCRVQHSMYLSKGWRPQDFIRDWFRFHMDPGH